MIFISDANDYSEVSLKEVSEFFEQLKGGEQGKREKVMVYGILTKSDDDARSCKMDQAGPPVRALDLIRSLPGSKAFNLCAPNWGSKLASLGKRLKQKVGRQVLQLKGYRDWNRPFQVFFGSQEIPQSRQDKDPAVEGYSYDDSSGIPLVYISENVELKPEPGADFHAEYIPLDLPSQYLPNRVKVKAQK